MVKKRKKKINLLYFLGLFFLLLFLQRYSLDLTAPIPDSEPWLPVTDRIVFGTLDLYPKEVDTLRFYGKHQELKDILLHQIPLFPYLNPYFFVLVDPAFQKDAFVQDKLLPYLKNNKYEIFEKANYSKEDMTLLLKKAALIEDPCVFLLVGYPDMPLIMEGDWVKYPIFAWQPDLLQNQSNPYRDFIMAGGGNIYSLQDRMSLEKMDITIRSPEQNQKIQFEWQLPFGSLFHLTQITAKTQNLTFIYCIPPSRSWIRSVQILYLFCLCIFILVSFLTIAELLRISRKKWKQKKARELERRSFHKYSIAWIEIPGEPRANRRLDKSPFLIGSSDPCDLVLNDASVSARHCQITEKNCVFFLTDLLSRNGTYINGKQVQQSELKDLDQIGVGKTILIFHKSSLQYISNEKVL